MEQIEWEEGVDSAREGWLPQLHNIRVGETQVGQYWSLFEVYIVFVGEGDAIGSGQLSSWLFQSWSRSVSLVFGPASC